MSFLKYLAMFTLTFSTAYGETLSYKQVNKIAYESVKNYFSYIDTIEVSDVKDFCPNYNSLSSYERQKFFSHLLTSMSYYESSFKTTTSFSENSNVSSKGLIGLSYGSTQYKTYQKYGCYSIKVEEDILDPSKSMRCALGIMENWMRKDKALSGKKKSIKGKTTYTGAARYWSTLRSPYKVVLKNYNNRVVTVGKRSLVISKIKENYPICH